MKKEDTLNLIVETIKNLEITCNKYNIPCKLRVSFQLRDVHHEELKQALRELEPVLFAKDALESVRKLRSEDHWAYYEVFKEDFANVREVLMLEQSKKDLRKALRSNVVFTQKWYELHNIN